MNEQIYDDLAIEREMKQKFGVTAEIAQVIARNVAVGRAANATVFLTSKKQLYALVVGQTKLTYGDVRKIMKRMGLGAELYVPPKGQPGYFDRIAEERIKVVFPGMKQFSDDDLRFYQTLAAYNPALVLLSEVRDGTIYQYDADASGKWRPSVKFAYRRIKTS